MLIDEFLPSYDFSRRGCRPMRMLCAFSLAFWSGLAFAYQAPEERSDTTKAESRGILPIPIAYYTPETGVAGGAGLLYFYRPEESNVHVRPSAMALFLIYTEKKQFIAQGQGEWYFQENEYRIDADLLFMRYPQKFFGVGNNTPAELEENYTSELFRFEFKALQSFSKGFNAGLTGLFENRKLSDLSRAGLLSSGAIPGSSGGTSSGVGPMLSFDTRDNIFAPEHGVYHQISVITFDGNFGSDYEFTRTVVNLRQYMLVGDDDVLATQLFGFFTSGSAPFHKLAELGGQNMMRGYYEGRFRDRQYLTAQAEYRAPLFWRIGFVVFAGLGDVAHRIGQFHISDVKPSYGFGFRYFFQIQERLNLRVDVGFGKHSSGLYIGPAESF